MEPLPGRYDTDGSWFKGNTHIHTTRSDGSMDYRNTARFYADAGYDFIFITDHGIPADIEAVDDLPLLALNGIEIDGEDTTGSYYHAVGLGCSPAIEPYATFEDQADCIRKAGGLLVLAHPYWTGNSMEDALRHPFDGVEVFNNVCRYLNGKALATCHYDWMLTAEPAKLGFAADDWHFQIVDPHDGAWIMAAAACPTKESILRALHAGSFYSTQGPRFDSIYADQHVVRVRTSPVQIIRITDNTSWGEHVCERGRPITQAEFTVCREHAYLRVEIEDECGRVAWTNAVLRGDATAS